MDSNLIMEVPKEDETRIIDNAFKNGYVCEEKDVRQNTVVLKFRKGISFNTFTFQN